MKFSDQTRLKLKRLFLIGLISGMIGALYNGLIRSFNPNDLFSGIFVGVGVSQSLAASEMFFLRDWKKRQSFAAAVILSTAYFLAAIIGILMMASYFFGGAGFLAQTPGQLRGFSYNDILFSLLISFGFSLVFQINGLIGGRVLFSFFTGKYHQPVEEDRIFMFLDLKSSTSIAERIGHIKFHKFINDFLFSISEAITASKGEIYKYVGDEIIITWKMKEGLKGENCIHLFFAALDHIRQQRDAFVEKYGTAPEFKAGMHCGKVVAGEMGDTKKEIAFLGDVINTAARIESECNPHHKRFLISADLFQKIKLGKAYRYEGIGTMNLKGKERSIELYAIEMNSPEA